MIYSEGNRLVQGEEETGCLDECIATAQAGRSFCCAPKQGLLSSHVLLLLLVRLAAGRILFLFLLGGGWFTGEGHGNAESNGEKCC